MYTYQYIESIVKLSNGYIESIVKLPITVHGKLYVIIYNIYNIIPDKQQI